MNLLVKEASEEQKTFFFHALLSLSLKGVFQTLGLSSHVLKLMKKNPPQIGWLLHIKLIADVEKIDNKMRHRNTSGLYFKSEA